jgi:hypothetical protein
MKYFLLLLVFLFFSYKEPNGYVCGFIVKKAEMKDFRILIKCFRGKFYELNFVNDSGKVIKYIDLTKDFQSFDDSIDNKLLYKFFTIEKNLFDGLDSLEIIDNRNKEKNFDLHLEDLNVKVKVKMSRKQVKFVYFYINGKVFIKLKRYFKHLIQYTAQLFAQQIRL